MAFTYNPNAITDTDLAKVRRKIGDTNNNDQLLQDAEINLVLTEKTGISPSAIECIRLIIAKLSRDVDRSNLGMSASRSQKIQHYKDLLLEMKKDGSTKARPFAGGVSESEKTTLAEDDDFTQPLFERGRDSIIDTDSSGAGS